jgi:apolipoprotein D and lipocalin family protein
MRWFLFAVLVVVLWGCRVHAPLSTVEQVDLPRFMGSWYVIAHIPAGIEKDAHAAVETYTLDDDGSIATTYVFRRGSLDGPVKKLTPRGFVHDRETNAEWRMQFLWPFRAEYLIAYLDEDYERTIVARTKRDMAWIMARTPTIPDDELQALIARLVAMGYDEAHVRLVPQRPADAAFSEAG